MLEFIGGMYDNVNWRHELYCLLEPRTITIEGMNDAKLYEA